jgi:hypothetical protein
VILERLDPDQVDWERLDAFADRVVFQTREWVDFVSACQGAEPVLATLKDGESTAGYFTGLVARRYGISILGSPMPGWTTSFMGFNLEEGVSRRAAAETLLDFAFRSLGCRHLELRDLHLDPSDAEGLRFEHTPWTGLEVDLRRSEEEIWAGMRGSCRTAIRKAERSGVVIEEADDIEFADDCYAQLRDVFAKQSLVPPYGVERIRALIRHVHPSGRLLLLRARNAEGACIATGIFPAMNRSMHFLAGASWRDQQHLRPNEPLTWYAMRYWRDRGIQTCDLGGFMSYKRKWGGEEFHVPWLRKSRSRPVSVMRNLAQTAFNARQGLRGRVRSELSRFSGGSRGAAEREPSPGSGGPGGD